MFNPLVPTQQEENEATQGYVDGYRDEPPRLLTKAYLWGYQSGVNDRTGKSDPERLEVAERMRALQEWRGTPQ